MVQEKQAKRDRAAPSRQRRSASAEPALLRAWQPPNVEGQLRISLGGSFVDEFVLGHRPSDVLRELVQNEFDAEGKSLEVTFEADRLSIVGSGRSIARKGWKRLSVIVGTGRTIGDDSGETIEPKTNGIGSKNFGLRSLFLFGDRIYVRSAGQVAVLDLPTLGTTRVPDSHSLGQQGVSIHVGFRERPFGKLPAFALADEARAFESMAGGVLSTLTKLALVGNHQGLRDLTLTSRRLGRTVHWRQRADKIDCKVPGIDALRRSGRMTETFGTETQRRRFEELEFARTVALDPALRSLNIPGYFRRGRDKVRIAVSIPIERGQPALSEYGRFFYPLEAPKGGTGTAIDVSAAFDLNSDRSALLDNEWNNWLCAQAADLTVDLLARDWFDRFGSGAYSSLVSREPAEPTAFLSALAARLAEAECWPTKSVDARDRFVDAKKLVIPVNPALAGHIDASKYIDERLLDDDRVRALALSSGANEFTVNSLIRLRCAPRDAGKLRTKLADTEANYFFDDYDGAMRDVDRQVAMAISLGRVDKLSSENLEDLKFSQSTLAKNLKLGAASKLVRVDPAVIGCPLPDADQLHPALFAHRAIASLCDAFDEKKWIRDVCVSARDGHATEGQLLAVEARILGDGAHYGRTALTAIRRSPVLRDRHGSWTAPEEMIQIGNSSRGVLLDALSAPSRAMVKHVELLAKLKIRTAIESNDLVRAASWVAKNQQTADRFEEDLVRYHRLLTRHAIRQLRSIAFLRTVGGGLEAPERLHLDNALNRLCVPVERIAGGDRTELYRVLLVQEAPDHEAILHTLDGLAIARAAPTRPDVFYKVLANAAKQDKGFHTELQDRPVLWASGDYHPPATVLAGHLIARLFDGSVPVIRRPETMVRSYLDIGAAASPQDMHWRRYFEGVGNRYPAEIPVGKASRRALFEAYALRASGGWPEGLSYDTHCLVDRRNRLHSLEDLRAGKLVENDFGILADAIDRDDLPIGIVDPAERARPFFCALGLQRLTGICGAGRVSFGNEAPIVRWFDAEHRAALLTQIRSPLFISAMHRLAMAFRQGTFPVVSEAEFRDALMGIERIDVLETITRQYKLQGHAVQVEAEVGTDGPILGIVRPKTKLDIHQLIAQALSELIGFTQVGDVRLFAAATMPLLQCRSAREIGVFLNRQGIVAWGGGGEFAPYEDEEIVELHERGELVDDAFAGILSSLTTNSAAPEPTILRSSPPSLSPRPLPMVFELPPFDTVQPVLEAVAGTTIDSRNTAGKRGGFWRSNGWQAPTAADVDRDSKVGMRGEELVYHLELDRVRALGHERPEEHVVWTSLSEPGADHDIRSIDSEGRKIWIEVKSTTGVDGSFIWPRREFELAVAVGRQYQLCRVYQAASQNPKIKRFSNPVRLLASGQLTLDLGDLKADIEGVG